MTQQHPEPSGQLLSALYGLGVLQNELLLINVVSFQWPQEMDSGIDLVGFALVPGATDEEKLRATAFVAGFQSKGSMKYFTEKQVRAVNIGKHESYWKFASLPIFVTSASNDGEALLVEDAFSFLSQLELIKPGDNRRHSIPTTVSLHSAAADIRLRMFAHALAPWVSQRLRRRTLAAEDNKGGLNRQSTWSLLAYAGGSSPIPSPKSWADCQQYFNLLEYLYEDHDCREELFCDLQIEMTTGPKGAETLFDSEWWSRGDSLTSPSDSMTTSHEPTYSDRNLAFEMLGDLIMLCLRYRSLHDTMSPQAKYDHSPARREWIQRSKEHSSNPTAAKRHAAQIAGEVMDNPAGASAKRDVDSAVKVVCSIWLGASEALEISEERLAKAVIDHVSFSVPNTHVPKISIYDTGDLSPGWVIRAVESGSQSLTTALRNAFGRWAPDTFYVGDWTAERDETGHLVGKQPYTGL